MPHQPKQPPVVCQYFTWRLFRRSGVYYADGRGGMHDLGKHSLGTKDRAQALERLKQLDQHKAVQFGLADEKIIKSADTISIGDGWDLYLEYCGRSPVLGGVSSNSLKCYRVVRDGHVKFCSKQGIISWGEFDKRAIEKYGNQLSRSLADRTVFFKLTTLKSVIKWLIAEKQLPAECRIDYPLRKPQGTDTYCYSVVEFTAMVNHCMAIPRLVWMAHVIMALAHTGLRISELAGLRWSDVDFDSTMIRVADERSSRYKRKKGAMRTTKGRRSRVIPIHPRLRKMFEGLPRKPDGRVLHAERGGMLRPRNVLRIFIRDVVEPLTKQFPTPPDEIGFEHGRIHSFRHFFCSQAFLGGASEGEIKEWLGHADSKMVEHYRHLRNEDAQRKMGQIDFMAKKDEQAEYPSDTE